MNALAWELVRSWMVWVAIWLVLLGVFAAAIDDDDAFDYDGRDDGAQWDIGHDYWVADELGVG
ncbi:hypothetical protein [Nocardia sp. NBC_01327]|uniref:hypothetical protein n=1 Tax=Nocardia sp. NBC_01327 TaxID=2903593 RepID=UPI002E12DACC|nr:hypothetical protein OG326_24025 [Nocardia sp. NBC_01327]